MKYQYLVDEAKTKKISTGKGRAKGKISGQDIYEELMKDFDNHPEKY